MEKIVLTLAGESDRSEIYRIRHEVYASELGQHHENEKGMLTDSLDPYNYYIIAKSGSTVAGFISVTPPGHPSYSIDKYIDRKDLPFPVDSGLYIYQ